MTVLEISSSLVDRMHIEGALFHAINKEEGIQNFDSKGGGVSINGYTIPIHDDGSFFSIDLTDVGPMEKVADSMEAIIGHGRLFPNVYKESIKLDNITPTKVDRSISTDADSFMTDFYDWSKACMSLSVKEEIETGFIQDSLDNIVGIIQGGEGSIMWPESILPRHGMRFHTHPQMWFMADPSVQDLKILRESEGNVCADAVASTFGVRGIGMLSYTMKERDNNVNVDKTVSRYIDEMVEMGVHEANIYLELKEDGIIDFDSTWINTDSLRESVRNRIARDEKREVLENIAKDGYRLSGTWEVVRY